MKEYSDDIQALLDSAGISNADTFKPERVEEVINRFDNKEYGFHVAFTELHDMCFKVFSTLLLNDFEMYNMDKRGMCDKLQSMLEDCKHNYNTSKLSISTFHLPILVQMCKGTGESKYNFVHAVTEVFRILWEDLHAGLVSHREIAEWIK